MFNGKAAKILYGGDYNPEQWPREVWQEDMRLFQLAGVNIATVNVFSWALNQPDENTYSFEWLDETLDLLHASSVQVCMGTSTAAHPAWMATKYPDVLLVESDGKKRKFGRRHNSCPSSPTYRKYAKRMAQQLAERYKDHPAILLWHVNNEYGLRCYCENCEQAFRDWLQQKYGTLDKLNEAWYTRFWGHTFYDWKEIVAPSAQSEHFQLNGVETTCFQGISLDYARFTSDQILDCYKLERDAIKAIIPDAVVTTNFQSNGTYKPLDYFKWAKELDIIGLDAYPTSDMPVSYTSMRHDLMRGLKDGDPYLLMESCPSQLNWKPQNALKRPGVNRLWSYQAIARGADSIMYFQLRRSLGAFEKFHGAMIDHAGHEHTRVFRECAELGAELDRLGDTLVGARTEAKVAILFDWENWWAIEYSSGLTVDLKYLNEVQHYYDAFFSQNIQVDLIGTDSELSGYDLVVAPVLYMVKEGYASKLEDYVQSGGTFVTTFFSGIVNENDRVTPGGYPGELRKLLGIWVEESDALLTSKTNQLKMSASLGSLEQGSAYDCRILCDLVHSEGAEVLAEYGSDFYKGMPALTKNSYGAGEAWYVASSPEPIFLQKLMGRLCEQIGIQPLLKAPDLVEVSSRQKDGKRFLFVLNHNEEPRTIELGDSMQTDLLSGKDVSGKIELAANGVLILESEQRRD
jgi:beta-galactosidase